MNESPKTGRVIGIDFEKKPEKKRLLSYTKETFPMYAIWIKEFLIIHRTIYENFYNILHDKFFEWLNQPKNYSKFMFEIRKEFMEIADEVLLLEIIIERFKKSENIFVIPVLQESSESESDFEIDSCQDLDPFNNLIEERRVPQEYEYMSDYDIDYFSDPEPCYNLMEENHIPDEIISEDDVPNYDDNYYSSFFSKLQKN